MIEGRPGERSVRAVRAPLVVCAPASALLAASVDEEILGAALGRSPGAACGTPHDTPGAKGAPAVATPVQVCVGGMAATLPGLRRPCGGLRVPPAHEGTPGEPAIQRRRLVAQALR
jgi:hypothetical protein